MVRKSCSICLDDMYENMLSGAQTVSAAETKGDERRTSAFSRAREIPCLFNSK